MKKTIALLLVLIIAVSLTACSLSTIREEQLQGQAYNDYEGEPMKSETYTIKEATERFKIWYSWEQTFDLDKFSPVNVCIFDGNRIYYSKNDLTIGELSKMTDEEIIDYCFNNSESSNGYEYEIVLNTDLSGNNVVGETVDNRPYMRYWDEIGERQSIVKFQIYDSWYCGLAAITPKTWERVGEYSYFITRVSESTDFMYDDINTPGVVIR